MQKLSKTEAELKSVAYKMGIYKYAKYSMSRKDDVYL